MPRDARHGVPRVRGIGAMAGASNNGGSSILPEKRPRVPDPYTIRGIRWPLKFVGGRVATSSGVQHLQEGMAQIIMCSKGDYLMRPTFGSGLPERVFDQVSLLALVWTDVADALRIWERRVQLVDVRAGPVESNSTFQLGAATTEAQQSGIVGIHIRFRERGADEIVDLNLSTQLR